MRIVHVTDWYIPNMGYQENCLPAEQAKLGHEVWIITSDKVPPYGGFRQATEHLYPGRFIGVGEFEEGGVHIYRLPSLEVHDQAILIGLIDRLNRLHPDVIHLHGTYAPSTMRVLISRGINSKLFVDDHSHETNFRTRSVFTKAYLAAVKMIYKMCGDKVSHFLPITYSAARILRDVLNVDGSQMTLLPLGANTALFRRSTSSRESLREELGLDENDILIITAGKFTRGKDITILLESFSAAVKSNPKLRLLLIGKGTEDYMNELRSLMIRLELRDRVMLRDFVPNSELPAYFNAADVGVWPGNPSITVIEAVATGLPVVVPKDDLAYKLVLDSGAGLGFTRKDVQSLCRSLIALANDRSLRHKTSERCLNLITETLSWEKVAQSSLTLYGREYGNAR